MAVVEGERDRRRARAAGHDPLRGQPRAPGGGPRLLTGHGTYVDDISPPGMLHACFVRKPAPRRASSASDTALASELHGVHAVFVAAD